MISTSSLCRMPTKAWPGRQAGGDLRAQRLLLDALDEGLDHRQRHVRLEQRHAHFAQALADVFFGDAAAAAQCVDRAGQPRGEVFEKGHGRGLSYGPYAKRTLADPRHRARSPAATDRVLLRHRSGHVVGQSLQDPRRGQGRQAHRQGAGRPARQARQLAGRQPGDAGAGQRRRLVDRNLVSAAHRLRARHPGDHGGAVGFPDHLLRARAEDLRGAQARPGGAVVHLHLHGAGVPRDAGHLVHQQGGVWFPAPARREAGALRRRRDVCRRTALGGRRSRAR